MQQNETIFVPFPRDLYNKVIIRSGGKVDPIQVAIWQLKTWIEVASLDMDEWTEEGLKAWLHEFENTSAPSMGDPSKGYQWKEVFLPNGSDIRMTYSGQNCYAQVRREKIIYKDDTYSPSQLASKIAHNSSRNAWRDLWIRFPGDTKWKLADEIRRHESKQTA